MISIVSRSAIRPGAIKIIGMTLSLVCGLAGVAPASSERFVSDKPSPLKRVRLAGETAVRFTGTVQISGRFLAAWEGLDARRHYLRVTFQPDGEAATVLPHAGSAVETLMLTNNEQAARMLLGRDTAEKLLAKGLTSAEGAATVTIGAYQAVIDCDHRWYLARLIAVAASRKVIVANGERRRTAC